MVEKSFFIYSQKVFKFLFLWSYPKGDERSLGTYALKWMVFLSTGFFMTIVSFSDVIEQAQHEEVTMTLTKALYFLALIVCTHKQFAAAFTEEKIYNCIQHIETLSNRFKDKTDINQCLGLYRKLFFVGTFCMSLSTGLFMIGPLTTSEFRPLVYRPHLPFIDVVSTPNWQLFYIYEIVVLLLITNAMMSYDTLFCGMMCVCSGYLTSICREIREFEDIMDDHQLLEDKMKETVDKINQISILTQKISDTFSTTTMTHIIYNCTTIALGLLMITILPYNLLCFTMMMVIAVEAFQLWIYCYFGQDLVSQRELLQRELYFIKWYETPRKFKTMLLFTIFESQRERYVYAGKVLPLSLRTFTEVFRKSYALFTFLNKTR